MTVSNRLPTLILAAGSSSRLGQSKQLLSHKGNTLITNTIQNVLSVNDDCTVVLGANHKPILKEIESTPVNIIINPNWKEGIGNSLAFGMRKLLIKQPNLESVLILLCDQIHITTHLLEEMKRTHFNSRNPVTACKYGESYGIPAIFNKMLFSELLKLKEDRGAKKIITKHLERTTFIDFPKGSIDIDIEDDLDFLT